MLRKFDLPPIWTALAILAIYFIQAILPQPDLSRFLRPWIGYLLIAYGVFMIGWAVYTLAKAKTAIEPRRTPKKLVTSGPFSMSRNPIYTGMLLITLGCSVLAGSIFAYLPFAGLFFLLKKRFVLPEEVRLKETFGQDAQSYIENTRRW